MGILDKNFKYVPANKTDIRKTFDRVRREQKKAKEMDAQKSGGDVVQLTRKG